MSLFLNQQQQAVHSSALHERMGDDVKSKQFQAHVPDRQDGGRLKRKHQWISISIKRQLNLGQ